MKGKRETIRESAREIPVYAHCDVLVVGGGPAGCAAASSAAQIGSETILMERYGYLGGMSTGGLVIWIDRMSDWSGRQVITGFANDLIDRIPKEGLLGPPKEIWGSQDPELVQYWHYRAGSFNGTVTWSPTIDPEMLKNASFDIVKERGIKLLLHSWAVAAIQEDKTILGVIFESKSGRQAILAKMVIDTTGDGDIFALAGESFETDIFERSIHHSMNVAFLCGGVDMERYINFQQTRQNEFRDITTKALEICGVALPHPTSRNDVCVFMGPKLSGYSCLEVEDLAAVEVESRRLMISLIDFYRGKLPGFEKAWIMQTAPQMGVRHSRRLEGVKKMNFDDWTSGKKYEDEIGVSPPPTPQYSNVSIPLHCLIPKRIDNLLVAGRNLSCDAKTHNFMREIPNCWVMGQAAGVAATVSVDSGALVRDVNANEVRRQLTSQGVYLQQ
jgi:hypothetical protein